MGITNSLRSFYLITVTSLLVHTEPSTHELFHESLLNNSCAVYCAVDLNKERATRPNQLTSQYLPAVLEQESGEFKSASLHS